MQPEAMEVCGGTEETDLTHKPMAMSLLKFSGKPAQGLAVHLLVRAVKAPGCTEST